MYSLEHRSAKTAECETSDEGFSDEDSDLFGSKYEEYAVTFDLPGQQFSFFILYTFSLLFMFMRELIYLTIYQNNEHFHCNVIIILGCLLSLLINYYLLIYCKKEPAIRPRKKNPVSGQKEGAKSTR